VYVTEIASEPKPIEGISTSTADLVGSDTIGALQRLIQQPAPDWTQDNTHDPGVALLELMAWLAESLLYRTGQLPERGLLHAARIAAAGLTLAQGCDQPEGQDYLRPRDDPEACA
jgi:hypothetical protein